MMVGVANDSRVDHPLVILGPTASGKSTLAMEIAGIVDDVELVTVDSMQVYRGMDIGTASPSAADRAAVPHHLIDIVEPSDDFDVGEFQRLAREALTDIRARGGVPVLVGRRESVAWVQRRGRSGRGAGFDPKMWIRHGCFVRTAYEIGTISRPKRTTG